MRYSSSLRVEKQRKDKYTCQHSSCFCCILFHFNFVLSSFFVWPSSYHCSTTRERVTYRKIQTNCRLWNDCHVRPKWCPRYDNGLLRKWNMMPRSSPCSTILRQDTTVHDATRRTGEKLDCDFIIRDISEHSAIGVKCAPKDSRWKEIMKTTWWNMKDGHFHVIGATKDLRVKMVCNDIIGNSISMHKETAIKESFKW